MRVGEARARVMAVLAPLGLGCELSVFLLRWVDGRNLHGVAYECGLLYSVFFDEGAHVLGHGCVVMARVMGGLAMVAKVLRRP